MRSKEDKKKREGLMTRRMEKVCNEDEEKRGLNEDREKVCNEDEK